MEWEERRVPSDGDGVVGDSYADRTSDENDETAGGEDDGEDGEDGIEEGDAEVGAVVPPPPPEIVLDPATMKVVDLKKALLERGQSVDGLKAALQARLKLTLAEGWKKWSRRKEKKPKRPVSVEGTQKEFCEYLAITIESYLPHSAGCRVTSEALKRRLEKRPKNVIAIGTDFSADLELRPRDGDTRKFYQNVSVIPFYIHFHDEHDVKCTDCLIV
jgi:hypothetical protein